MIGAGNDADQTVAVNIVIHSPDDTADYTVTTWQVAARDINVPWDVRTFAGAGCWLSNSAVTSATIFFSAGNIDTPGDLYMIGIEDA
jgi:hypothetical protein